MSGRLAVRCLAACLAAPALACAQPAVPAAAEAAGPAREAGPPVILSAPRAPPPAGFCSVTLRCAAPAGLERRASTLVAPRAAPGRRGLRRSLALAPRALGRGWRTRVRLRFGGSWFGLARPLAGGGRLEFGYRADGRMEVGLRERF